MASPVFLHWFIVPLFGCGLLCCTDATQLLESRGRNLFDPVPLIGIFGLFFFYVGPLLHVWRDYWFINSRFAVTDRPDDWRTWLGWMGIINLIGLLIYQTCHKHFSKGPIRSGRVTVHQLRLRDLRLYGFPLLALTFLLQLYIYGRFGGFGGYVDAYADNGRGQAFSGLGWMMCISESFPILLLIVFAAAHRERFRDMTTMKLGTLLGVVFVLVLLFGGLRGSRSNTVISLLFAVGIIHAMVHKLSWRFFVVFGAAIVAFMYVYGFYKISPQTFLAAMTSSESRTEIEQGSGRDLDTVLLADFERSDIQAYLLYRFTQAGSRVEYAYGSTYVDGVLNFVPRGISSYRPPGKLKYGTDALFGEGTYAEGRFASTKVYGLAGETMLNFGPWGIPIGFLALGVLVGRLRALCRRIEPSDSRQYLIPILSLACCIALSSDVDNLLFTMLQHALMPCMLIWCASTKAASGVRPLFVRSGRKEVCFGNVDR